MADHDLWKPRMFYNLNIIAFCSIIQQSLNLRNCFIVKKRRKMCNCDWKTKLVKVEIIETPWNLNFFLNFDESLYQDRDKHEPWYHDRE